MEILEKHIKIISAFKYMPKKVIVQKNNDYSSDESETLTKSKVKKTEELKTPKQKKND